MDRGARDLLSAEFSAEQFFEALKNLKKGKSPGPDGLPVEFYLHFWDQLKDYFLASFHESFARVKLSFSQRNGLLRLIPKKGALAQLMNWRPISLLNNKILSDAFKLHVQSHLEYLIHQDQRGFVPGRQIGENIMDAITVLEFVQEHDI